MQLRSAALTDIGRIRRQNEDRLLCEESLCLFGVADGVGGLPGGAEAAQCAVDLIKKLIRNSSNPPDLELITLETNHAVAQLGFRLSPHFGIGSTLTYGVFRDGKLRLAHVGDSRCYLLRGRDIECLTLDHSVENEAKARRAKGELIWVNEQHRNALTRCIGQSTPLEVDVATRTVMPKDRYLFCSDGITRLLREEELAEHLARNDPPADILHDMIELTNVRGGLDNATAVLVVVDQV
ncbi:MAG: serine/threonine-protein phosphatase [Nibricoccus sp.]